MAIGLVTLAVITAQVASSFVVQGATRAQNGAQAAVTPPEADPSQVTLAELDRRLARIEELLTAAAAPSPEAGPGGPPSG
jgi:hypothetical protein